RRPVTPDRPAPHAYGPRVPKRVNRLRNRLILIFLAATLAPLAATIWITTSLLEWSLDYSATGRVEALSKELQRTAKELFKRQSEDRKRQAQAGTLEPRKYAAGDRNQWPAAVETFAQGDDAEGFVYAGTQGDQLDYLVRHDEDIWAYSASLGDV